MAGLGGISPRHQKALAAAQLLHDADLQVGQKAVVELDQPLGGTQGRASDIEIEAAQIMAMRERLNRIFAVATGQPYDKIARETERNLWMSAPQAVEYGLVHRIIERAAEV